MSRPHSSSRARSQSPIPSRPITPLRPSSRTSFRGSTTSQSGTNAPTTASPLDALEPQFAELSDSLSDLEANFMHLQLLHESLSRFGESFASFLYGLNMQAFVVDFPEQPGVESIQRWREKRVQRGGIGEGETTILADRPVTKSSGNAVDLDSTLLSDTTFASLKATPARRRTGAPVGGTGQRPEAKTPGRATSAGSNVTGTITQKKSGIPARSGSVRGGAAGRGRGSGLPTRGRGSGIGRGGVR